MINELEEYINSANLTNDELYTYTPVCYFQVNLCSWLAINDDCNDNLIKANCLRFIKNIDNEKENA